MIKFHNYENYKDTEERRRNNIKNGYLYPQPSTQKDGTWVTCPKCKAKVFVPIDGWGECACGKVVC